MGTRIQGSVSKQNDARAARQWLWATAGQAGVTVLLLAMQRHFEGSPKEMYARMIAALGIVATWSLALRTIRARLVELIGIFGKTQARKRTRGARILKAEASYVKAAIWRLRIIAAGLTIPFFVMPVCFSIMSVFLSIYSRLGAEYWISVGSFMLFSACIVAGYFYWAIMPTPALVPGKAGRRYWRK